MFITTILEDPLLFIRLVLILIVSITIHELAHGVAALSQGDSTPQTTGHMTLNPVVHMGWESLVFLVLAGIAWGQMPVNPRNFRYHKLSNIIVSAAGPLSNLALAGVFIALLYLSQNSGFFSEDFLYRAAQINIILCLFNLLPIPPLDGFHIFSEIFPGLKGLENTYFGLFAMAIIWFSQIGTVFFFVSSWLICTVLPALAICNQGF